MSKIGKKPITVPPGVEAKIENNMLLVKGKEGTLMVPLLPFVRTELKDGAVSVSSEEQHKQARANWGTMAALVKNALHGVQEKFLKILEVEGVGYKAVMEGVTLVLQLGFTHPVKFSVPEGVSVTVEKNQIKISGIDRAKVGLVAAQIRKFKKPEPYKGKGIHYLGEVIRRKATKKVAGTGIGA